MRLSERVSRLQEHQLLAESDSDTSDYLHNNYVFANQAVRLAVSALGRFMMCPGLTYFNPLVAFDQVSPLLIQTVAIGTEAVPRWRHLCARGVKLAMDCTVLALKAAIPSLTVRPARPFSKTMLNMEKSIQSKAIHHLTAQAV